MTRFNVTHLAVLDDKASITIEFQPWMRHFFWLISVGCFSFALFWFYARMEVLGSAYLLGGIFLAALPSYKVETVIDRLSESVIHTTRFFGSKRQTQFPLGVSSLLANNHWPTTNGSGLTFDTPADSLYYSSDLNDWE